MQDDMIFIPPAKRETDPWAYFFVAPALVLLAVFLFFPAAWAVFNSVVARSEGARSFTLAAYSEIGTPLFWRATLNTMYFAGIYVPATLILGYVIARSIQRSTGRNRLFLLLFFLPALIPAAASGTVWRSILADSGMINALLGAVGMGPVAWLSTGPLVLPCAAIVCTWHGTGLIAAIFLAAMLAVPKEYEEMADIDGASGWRRFYYVTLPSVQNAFRVSLILLLINTHRAFGPIYLLTRDGGPANYSTNLPMLVFRDGLQLAYRAPSAPQAFSAASALSTVVCFTIAILVVLLRRFPVAAHDGGPE